MVVLCRTFSFPHLFLRGFQTKRPEDLKIVRIYAEILYEDDRLWYPMIYACEYEGVYESDASKYRFRTVGTTDIFLKREDDYESLDDAEEPSISLSEWVRSNPDLAP
jgi:hypothetical protein